MFGVMRPDEAALTGSQRARHRRYYCGLCHGVGSHVGHGWRALHSHDAVFVATVVDGLLDQAAEPSSCRCPMLPVVHRQTRDPGSVAMRFAVGMQLLLADQWIADKVEEGSRPARFMRDVLASPVSRGVALLRDLNVDLAEIDQVEVRQRLAEERSSADGPATLLDAARPTELALASAFGAIAALPGAPADQTGPLREFGAGIGRAIYLLDALEDLSDDAVDRAFNPCLVQGQPCADRVRRATELMHASLQRVDAVVHSLPWQQNQDLVAATVGQLRQRGQLAATRAAQHATTQGRGVLMRWVAQPRWVHAAAALMTAFTTFWAVFSTTAVAATQQVSKIGTDLAPRWLVPRAQSCPCDKCGDACSNCGDGCSNCGKGCSECGDSCSECGDSCSDCGNSCNNCNLLGALFS